MIVVYEGGKRAWVDNCDSQSDEFWLCDERLGHARNLRMTNAAARVLSPLFVGLTVAAGITLKLGQISRWHTSCGFLVIGHRF